MKGFLSALFLSLFFLSTSAQTPSQIKALGQKGSIKSSPEKHVEKLTPAEKSEVKPMMDAFQGFVKQQQINCEGFNLYQWNDYKMPEEPAILQSKKKAYRTLVQQREFGVNSKDEIGEISGSKTFLSVQVNSFWKIGDRYTIGNDTLIGLPQSRKTINGCEYFSRTYGNGLDTIRCFIVNPDFSKFLIPISRKNYLNARLKLLKAELEFKKNRIRGTYKMRTPAEQMADKKAGMDKLAKRYKGEELKKAQNEYLATYKTDQQLLDELLSKVQNDHQEQVDLFNQLLKNDEEWLSKVAVVKQGNLRFQEFDDDKPGALELYLANTKAFEEPGSRVKPLFIAVLLTQEGESAASVKWNKQLIQWPFQELRQWLPKP